MTDWKARAEREAAAIIAEAMPTAYAHGSYTQMVTLVAIGWLQGANYGDHERLNLIEVAFDELRAAL